jgi:hypothetical protein
MKQKPWRSRNPFCPEGASYCVRGPDWTVDWIGYQTPTQEVALRLALEAEGGRLRSIGEAAAIPAAYAARDRWTLLTRDERIALLRRTRAKIAKTDGKSEYKVQIEEIARELGLKSGQIRKYQWVI